MNVTLIPATKEDQTIVKNLGRFYAYEMSRDCGFLPGWETPSDGLFEAHDFSCYWEDADRYPFLIKINGELAGFVLVNKIGSTSEVDWNLGEFFIVSKYQGKGIGRAVAVQTFDRFQGIWEVMQIPENKRAVGFWEKVVSQYTEGKFQKATKIIPEPVPHPMIVLQFKSS